MALHRQILTTADLPPEGTARESGTFDFKGVQDPNDQHELAKDIGAFANALGGVVLVGAVEDKKRGTLGCYKPIADLAVAEALRKAYELAATQRCNPQPVVEVKRIETAPPIAAGHVVAVNVHAAPMGPIGVRREDDEEGSAYSFPLRTATQTYWMKPTELAMLMVPEIRRVAILLDGIPTDQRDDVWLYSHTHISTAKRVVRVLGVDALLTTLRIAESNPAGDPMVTAVPLDRVTSVWQRSDKLWCVSVQGAFQHNDNEPLYYLPG